MTKREEINRILHGVGLGGIEPSEALKQLSDLGVVIKADELPIITKKGWYYMVESLKYDG